MGVLLKGGSESPPPLTGGPVLVSETEMLRMRKAQADVAKAANSNTAGKTVRFMMLNVVEDQPVQQETVAADAYADSAAGDFTAGADAAAAASELYEQWQIAANNTAGKTVRFMMLNVVEDQMQPVQQETVAADANADSAAGDSTAGADAAAAASELYEQWQIAANNTAGKTVRFMMLNVVEDQMQPVQQETVAADANADFPTGAYAAAAALEFPGPIADWNTSATVSDEDAEATKIFWAKPSAQNPDVHMHLAHLMSTVLPRRMHVRRPLRKWLQALRERRRKLPKELRQRRH